MHVGDSDDHGAGVAQGPVGTGFTGRRRREHLGGPEALGAPGQRPLVLDHDRDTAQRPLGRCREHLSRALREGLDHGVDRWVALLDPLQRRLEQLRGIGLAGGDRRGLVAQRQVEGAHAVSGGLERSGQRSASTPLVSSARSSHIAGQKS